MNNGIHDFILMSEFYNSFVQFFVFGANELNVKAKQFNVRYCGATNEYERFIRKSNGEIELEDIVKKWQSCAYRWQNICRKEEHDWHFCYLARAEDTDHAEIEWKFDFSDRNLVIKDIQLKFDYKIYESGKIEVFFLHKGNKSA